MYVYVIPAAGGIAALEDKPPNFLLFASRFWLFRVRGLGFQFGAVQLPGVAFGGIYSPPLNEPSYPPDTYWGLVGNEGISSIGL